jgi:hypothetical protein
MFLVMYVHNCSLTAGQSSGNFGKVVERLPTAAVSGDYIIFTTLINTYISNAGQPSPLVTKG